MEDKKQYTYDEIVDRAKRAQEKIKEMGMTVSLQNCLSSIAKSEGYKSLQEMIDILK